MTTNTKDSVKNVVEKLIYIAIVALVIFTYNINSKVNTITANKESIGKLWSKYSSIDARIDIIVSTIGKLEGRHLP